MEFHMKDVGDDDDKTVNNFRDEIPDLNLEYVPRSPGMSEGASGETNSLHVLDVAPLNSMPYIGPPIDVNSPPIGETEAAESVGPAMIFLPAHSTREEWENLKGSTVSGIALTGSAALGQVGIIGLRNIAQNKDSYYFRVNLPGVANNEREFKCVVEPDGKVLINGVRTTGEKTVCTENQVFTMLTQNLGPQGPFSISFRLPGPADPQSFLSRFVNGVLEGFVKKM